MIKTFLSALSVILFVIPIITYSFFPSSNLNIWLSTQPILAQIYAFPLATATMAAILSFLFFSYLFTRKINKYGFTLAFCSYYRSYYYYSEQIKPFLLHQIRLKP
ncbi:hypothetical protein PNI0010_01712 [Streptococcus pneumoniae PNI0010]|nr:hypothetical protein PNI0010_01712 [Streptococcus pneumoniae PNI0010]